MVKKAFTFLEILIATFILSLIMLGLVSVFISSKRLIYYNRGRIMAAELGKLFLNPLQSNVRQDTWGASSNCLSQASCASVSYGTAYGLDKNYTATYTIRLGNSTDTPDPIANTTLVRVKTVINWTKSDIPQ